MAPTPWWKGLVERVRFKRGSEWNVEIELCDHRVKIEMRLDFFLTGRCCCCCRAKHNCAVVDMF